MQLLIQGQWWSMQSTHRMHVVQWWDRSGFIRWQMKQ